MVSKNNVQERQRKDSDQKPHYAIKKLTIGVVSVLVGTTFAAYNSQASADTTASLANLTAQTNDVTPTGNSLTAGTATAGDDNASAAASPASQSTATASASGSNVESSESQSGTPASQTSVSAAPASTVSTAASASSDTTTESAVSRQLTISVSYEGAANNPLQETRQLTFNGIQHQTVNDGTTTTTYTWQQNHASIQTTTPVVEGYVADASAVDQEVSLDEQGNLVVEVNGQKHLLSALNPSFSTDVKYQKVGKVIPVAEDGTVIQTDANGAYVDSQAYQNDAADATKVTYTTPTIAGYITMQASDEGIHTPNSATDDTKIYYVPLKSTKTVTRTITYSGAGTHTPANATYSIVFTQTNARDEQTGGLTRTWDKERDSWPSVIVPAIDGYTPNVTEIAVDDNVTYQTADQNISVIYSPNQQNGQVDFIDCDDQNQTIKTVAISGFSEGQIDFTTAATALSDLEQAGYALATTNDWVDADGKFKTAEFDTDDNITQTFKVYLVHQQATTTTDKTITRKITYTGAKDNPESVSQTAVFTETIVKDLQNGKTLQDTWKLKNNGFTAVDTPTIKGYTPNLKTVAAEDDSSISHTDSDQTVEVVYTPDDQKATVSFYIDQQNVYSLPLLGKTDQKIDLTAAQAMLNNFEQAGYTVLDGDLNADYTYDDEDDQDQTITVKLQQPTTSKTVHLTVNYSGAGDAIPAAAERDIVFIGTISYDPATSTTKTDWVPQMTDAAVIATPVVDGLIASQAQIITSPDQENQTATVSYAKIGVLQAVDEAGNVLATINYQNDPNDATKVGQTALPAVSGYVPKDGQQFITPTDAIRDIQVVYLPIKAQFTQTITFTGAGAKTPTPQTQTIALTDSQTSGTFTFVVPKLAGYDIQITGAAQTVDQGADILVTGATVAADSSNPAPITVTYTPRQQTGEVLFVDDTDQEKQLATAELTGITDQSIDFSQAADQLAAYLKAGYALAATGNDCLDENGSFKAAVYSENNNFTVHLIHQTAVINSAADAQKLVLPSGVSLSTADQQALLSENSYLDTTTASRTVNYAFSSNDATSQVPTATDQTQTVTFNRTNSYTVDLATGAVTKNNGDWQIAATPASDGSARLDAITPLTFAGWYLAISAVTDSLDAAATADDILKAHAVKPGQTQTLTLTYQKLAAATISILDEGINSVQSDKASLLNTYTVKGQQGAAIDCDQVTEIVSVTTKDPDGKENTVTAESAANANAQLNAYLKAGYQLDQSLATIQNDNGTTTYTFKNGAVVTEKDGVNSFANKYDADDATVQNYQVYLVHGTTTATKNKTITRTIYLHNVDQTTTKTVQSCALTETIITDNVTGDTVSDTWNSGDWEAFEIPAVDGYVASENDLAKTTVYNTTSDQVVNVIYVPNSATATIKIIDDDAGNSELNEYQVSGTTAGQVNFNQAITQLKKYLTGNYTFNTANKNNSAKFTIAYRNGKLDSLSAADIYGATAKEYEIHLQHQKSTSKEYADMTRTINLELPSGTKIVTQTVQISRTATTDLVTGSRSYGDWTTTSAWPECAVPAVPGYQASRDVIVSETVTNTTPDKSINVVYTPIVQHANITIIDDTQNTTLAQADLTGTYGQAVDFDKPAISLDNVSPNGKLQEFLKNGYVLASQDNVASDNQHFATTVYGLQPLNIIVHLKEGTQPTDETKTLMRTINYIVNGDVFKTVSQSADLMRTKTVNLVTGATTYSEWTTGQWDKAVSPTHETDPIDIPDGYYPDKEIVSEQTVLHTTGNQIVLVYYSRPSNYRSATINIIDEDDGNVTLWTQETAGKTGDSVDFASANTALSVYLNQGFVAASDSSLEHQAVNDDLKTFAQRTFADDSTQNVFTVYLKHGTQNLGDENREVTRTVNYVFPDGTTRTYVQAVVFKRTVTEDLVDERNIYGDWAVDRAQTTLSTTANGKTTDSKPDTVNHVAAFGKLDTAQVAKDANQDITGYVPSQAVVDELTGITEQTASQVVNITFSPKVESAVIGMIDTTVAADPKTGTNDFDFQSIYTNTASGYFGKSINVDLVNQYLNQFLNQNGYRLGVDTQTGTAKLINDATPDNADLSQTETLTYTYTAGNTTAGQITETITTEPATVDNDGNTIIVKHYHFVMDSAASDVTATTTTTAAGNSSTVYQLDAKPFLDSAQTLVVPMLHYRTTANYSTSNPPAGTYKDVVRTIIYHLPDGTTETKNQIVRFTRSITTDHVTGMQTASSWSTGNDNYAWIETQLPDKTTTQSEVTRSSTWSSQSTPAADDEKLGNVVKGYTPTQKVVDEKQQVTAATPDSVIEISYQADKQAATIQIIDSTTGDVLSNYNVHGVTNEAINFDDANAQLNYYLTHGYLLANDTADHHNNDVQISDGQTSFKVVNYDNEDAQNQTFNVYLIHDEAKTDQAVDPNLTSITDTSGKQIDYVDNVKSNPKVTNPASYVQTVTSKRTTKFVFDGDSTTKPNISDCVQTVTWTRTVSYTIDLVTGKETPTYGEWKFVASTPNGKQVQTAVNGGQAETTATMVTADEQEAGYVAAVSGSFAGWYQVNSDSATGKQTLPALANGQGLNQTVILEYKEYAKARIQIIDANPTENQGTLYDETKADGQYKQGTSIDFAKANSTLAELLSHGYVFDHASTNGNGTAVGTADGFAADTYDAKDNEDQNFIIYLRHDTAQATTQLTNDSRLTAASGRTAYLDSALKNTTLTNVDSYQESATSTRTVIFAFTSNTALPSAIAKVNGQKVTQVVTYTRPISYTIDLVTGTATRDYQAWLVDKNVPGTTSQGTTTTIDQNGQTTLSAAVNFNDDIFPTISGQIDGWYLASGDASAAQAPSPRTDRVGANVASSITLTFKKLQNAYIKIVDDNETDNQGTLYDESTSDANSKNLAQKQGTAIDFTNSQAKLNDLLKSGYVVDTEKTSALTGSKFTATNFDSDDTGDQTITVYLKHGTAIIGVNTDTNTSQATIGGQINLGSKNTASWPDAVRYDNLARRATQTIEYLYQGGGQAHENNVQTVVLTRTVTIDKVTGKVIKYSNFTTQKFADVISPTIDNYRYVNSKDRVVAGQTASATFDEKGNEIDSNLVVTYPVYYKTNGTWKKINEPVYDQDGQVSYRTDATGTSYLTKADDASTVTATVPTYQGYTAVFETNQDSKTDHTLTPNKQTSIQDQVIELQNAQAGQDSTVTYTPDPQQIFYQIYDQTLGKNISVAKEDQLNNDATTGLLAVGVSDASAASQTTVAKYQALKDDLVNRGYKLVLADSLPAFFDHDDAKNQTVTIKVVHDYAEFKDAQTALNAENNGTVTDTDNQQAVYLWKKNGNSKLSYIDTTTATRTINFEFKGNAQSKPQVGEVDQTVTYTRPIVYTIDLVDGTITRDHNVWNLASAKTGPTTITMNSDGKITTEGASDNLGTAKRPPMPAVTGSFAGWYLSGSGVPALNADDVFLQPDRSKEGQDANQSTTVTLTYLHYQKATIQIIDDDQNDKQTLANDHLTTGDGNLYKVDLEGQQGADIVFTAANALLEKLLAAGYQYEAGMDKFAQAKFDSDDTVDQNFVVKLIHQSVTLDGKNQDQLPTSGNISPGSLSQATWPKDASSSNLTRQAERSIIYQYADGSSADNEQVKDVHDQAILTRTVTIDKVTGKVLKTGEFSTYDFEEKQNPVIAGYHTKNPSTEGFTAKAEKNLKNETTVYYYANGYVKAVDSTGKPFKDYQPVQYTTVKDDISKVENITIPTYAGYTAEINGQTVDQGTIYAIADPDQDTEIVYTADAQKAAVQIFDDDVDPKTPLWTSAPDDLNGYTDALIDFSNSQKQLDYYLSHGYQLAANGNDDLDGTQFKTAYYDNVDDVEQTFVVHLVHGKRTFSFGDPQPTGKMYSDDENSPAWPTMTLSEDATQTIKYAGAGTDTPGNKMQTAEDAFTRTATVDLVTGKVEYSTFSGNDVTFKSETTDAVPGYHVAENAKTVDGLTATAEKPNRDTTVTYLLNGSLRFTDQSQTLSSAQLQSIQYTTDDNDPRRVTVTIPLYSGYTAKIGDQIITSTNNKREMTATTGAGSDMEVVYTADAQKAQVQIFDDDVDSKTPLWTSASDDLNGYTDALIDFSNSQKQLDYYLSHGYQLAANGNDDLDGTQFKTAYYDNVDDVEQTFVVHLVHGKRTFNFGDSQPTGKMYSDKKSPVWPTMTLSEDATQTIKYAGAGTDTPGNKTQTAKDAFTRTAMVDLVTGKVEYSTFSGNNVTFKSETTDAVPGYHVAENAKTAGGLTTATAEKPNLDTTITYLPNGSLRFTDQSQTLSFAQLQSIQYTTDDNDPRRVTVTIPLYSGYTAKIGDQIITSTNNKREMTATTGAGSDMEVVYTADAQKAQVQIFDDDAKDSALPIWQTELSGTTAGKIEFTAGNDQLKYYLNHGYQLAANGNDNLDGTQFKTAYYDNVDGVEQTFVAHLVHRLKTVGVTDPYQTGQKIYADTDVTWPVLTLTKDASQTIHYQGIDGQNPADHVDRAVAVFTRTATIDLVTGAVTSYSKFTGQQTFEKNVATPVVPGYHVDEKDRLAGGLTATPDDPTPETTVTYMPNGFLKALDASGQAMKGFVPVQYTTDQTNPSQVAVIIPTFAGYTATINGAAVDQGIQYQIVDANQDTEVVYTANPQKLTVEFIDQTDHRDLAKVDLTGKTEQAVDFSEAAKKLSAYLTKYVLSDNNPDLDQGKFKTVAYDAVDTQDQIIKVYLEHGHEQVNETKYITENITYVYQNADQQIAFGNDKQTEQAVRTGIRDLVTDQIVWSDKIEPISFDSVDSPLLIGYQAQIKQVPVTNVTVTNDNWATDLDQNIKVVYEPIAQTAIVSFVDQDDLKQTFPTITINGLSDQLIDFKAVQAQLQNYLASGYVLASDADLADAKYDRTDDPQFFTIYLKHGQQPDQRTKQVTETIKYVYADQTQAALPVVETITATQSGIKDLVTQQTDWNGKITFSADFTAVTSPLIEGYTPDQAVIEPSHPDDPDWNQLDIVKIVTYAADPQKLTFTIFDRTANTNLSVPNDLLTSIGISDHVLATGTSDAKLDQAAAARYQQLIKTVTEYFAAQAYGDVQSEQLPAVFDHDDTTDQNVVISLAHETGTVSHMVDQQKPTDDQGHQLPDSLDPLLYKEESFWDYPTSTRKISYNFQTNDANDVPQVQQAVQTVTYRRTVSYTVDLVTGQIVGEPIYGEPAYYTSSTTAVFAKQDHGSNVVQTSGANDSLGTNQIPGVTGEFNGWYEELADNNGTETVLFDGSRWYVEVAGQKQFVPADQLGKIVFKRYQKARTEIIDDDDNGKQLFIEDLIGKQQAAVDFQTAAAKLDELLSDGYQLANQAAAVPVSKKLLQRFGLMLFASLRVKTSSMGQKAFGSAAYDTDDTNVQVFTVHVTHQKETRQEAKTIIRTINYHQPDGTVITVTQPATITRTVLFDKVTKQATPTTAWTMTAHAEQETSQINGYTPDKIKVDEDIVDGTSQNSSVDVVYYRDQQKAIIDFVDDDRGQTLSTVTVDGKLNDSIDFSLANQALESYRNHGYQLAFSGNDDLNDAQTAFKAAKYHAVNGVQNYVVHLTHVWQDATEDKTIIRTINYHLPDGTLKTITQPATINRSVKIDKAVGTKICGKWSQASWPAIQVPSLSGYSPSQAAIVAETVDGTTADKTVDVFYQGHEQAASVRIIDLTTGKPLTEEKLHGLSGEPLDFAKINAELTVYLSTGYTLASNNQAIDDLAMKSADFDSDDQSDQAFVVYLTHRINEVPETQTVTRVIKYRQPDGSVKTVQETQLSKRLLRIDAVTGQKVASGDWTPISWHEIVPPIFKGYTATVSQNIPQNDGTVLVEVSYQAELNDDHNHKQDDHNQDADKHNSQTIHQLDQSDSHSVDSAAVSPSILRTDKSAGMTNKPTGKQTDHSNNQRLVQTGNQATGKQTVLGGLLLGLAGMLSGLGLKRKKRGDK
ncbi:mucin-binding protein [Limosilactobacillus mucosae]|uniref:mucin-binding protein n=1 Tax=Limosilactobacillus mucosae TaxID=97478 RepID=UPI00399510D7